MDNGGRIKNFAIQTYNEFMLAEIGVKNDTVYFAIRNESPNTQILIDTSLIRVDYADKRLSIFTREPSEYYRPPLLILKYDSVYLFTQKLGDDIDGPIDNIGLSIMVGYKDQNLINNVKGNKKVDNSGNTVRKIIVTTCPPSIR